MKITNKIISVDKIDKIILKGLIKNARISIMQLSKLAGISGAAVHQRLKKLENSNLITGSKISLNAKLLGFKTIAFVGVFLDKAMINTEAVKKLDEIPEILECHYTTGNWSIFLKILCRDNEHLMNILNKKIQTIKGVSRTETFISLNQQIDKQISL
ncbi:MAG: Lrp/AsnC ligand binding domain-containing protein [Bacteroidota bacterium]|jgi:Lrp/AsnC family transcriptional regulator for asnA, asnC and gidA|nr:Lrp/AsnC ligand binding domain-containing protein [Bacteroidota bacterium]MEC8614914.1 Lrp/AsnC ligand binding domain-containing protein [Bacteroidota bacterium]